MLGVEQLEYEVSKGLRIVDPKKRRHAEVANDGISVRV